MNATVAVSAGVNAACTNTIIAAGSGGRRSLAPHERDAEPLTEIPGEPFSSLNAVELFADITADDIAAIDRASPPRTFSSGELVFSQSQPVTALFILKTGRICVFRVTEEGKALTIAILEPSAVFGEMPLVSQRMYDNYAEAIENSVTCQLSAGHVEEHFLSNPEVAVKISRLLGEQVARLEERLTDMALRPLAARAASTLLKIADSEPKGRFSNTPSVRLTHEQLAGLLGATGKRCSIGNGTGSGCNG